MTAEPSDDGVRQGPGPDTEIDEHHANAARMYDWFLGGAHNFAVDRDRARAAIAANPNAQALAWANRSFLQRVVEWALDAGIRQFLDLGSGIPTVGNVHEIVHARDPRARVAYVDLEPVAVAHAREILDHVDTATVTRADLRDPPTVLTAPGVAELLEFDQPIALLAMAVLHFVDDSWDVAAILARYAAALAPGSIVAFSHGSVDQDDPRMVAELRREIEEYGASATPLRSRDRHELRAMLGALDGFAVVEPGLVDIIDWPAPAFRDPAGAGVYGAVARRESGRRA